MNYIRGAVSAISAPYQYYKDINPSTLTGAIDVIVIRRPAQNGEGGTELACSPFHVRFGKWQVLRPAEKKVNVSVNGQPIPFNMKIGDAGEAFFVFETDDDVPADLITSPILQPTQSPSPIDISSDRFGAKKEPGQEKDAAPPIQDEDSLDTVEVQLSQEPEFLDLDAPAEANLTPKQTPARLNMKKIPSHGQQRLGAGTLPSPPPSREPSVSRTTSVDKRVDEALRRVEGDLDVPKVEYHNDIALDIEGYHSQTHPHSHSHEKDRSDTTIHPDDGYPFPDSARSHNVNHHQLAHSYTLSSTESPLDTPIPFPAFRATSEPPPDIPDELPSENLSSTSKIKLPPPQKPQQEYSWEWGAFPQPSPMTTSFGRGGRLEGLWKGKGKLVGPMFDEKGDDPNLGKEGRLAGTNITGGEGLGHNLEHDHGRSMSVPPEIGGSPTRKKRRNDREHGELEDSENEASIFSARSSSVDKDGVYGAGGRLSARKNDLTKFVLSIERRKVIFELALVDTSDKHERRGRKDRDGRTGGVSMLGTSDEVEAARIFDANKIDFEQFLKEDGVVNDPRLVVRWAGDQYITRTDGSPLMSSLVYWRDSALRQGPVGIMRPVSPVTSEDELSSVSGQEDEVKQPENQQITGSGKKPTSLSWVQWWSRSRRQDMEAKGKHDRPSMRGTVSAPLSSDNTPVAPDLEHKAESDKTLLTMKRKGGLVDDLHGTGSAPALPSTPVQRAVDVPSKSSGTTPGSVQSKKYAKTLRLTSDQLESLNLKPGANTITFSLSASGVIACTARIFVWDSTDLVLVSDIDGTITKSDGLGHVFAMIGRDWTHLGVAKLYTDISRNGYKIMYLTSRAIGQADATRGYLKGIKQNDYQLPEGPVIMSPDRLMASLHREVIMRKPEVFKMACLRDIQRLFGDSARNPFYAGFGNRITDALSYRSVNIPSARIFTIDSSGEVKMELLELAGYKSSYIHMTDLVDQMFPPIHRKWTPEYTDFNYWKTPLHDYPLPDFSPPSPAMSARSDTSNQSTLARLRNFSLGGSRPKLVSENTNASNSEVDLLQNMHRRQMSSLEKLGSTLGAGLNGLRRSMSPDSGTSRSSSVSYADSDDEDIDVELGPDKKRRRRRKSMTSMPGSLDDMHFDMDDDEVYDGGEGNDYEEYDGEREDGEDEEAAAEEAFDEDLLAAGEMKDVPFL